MAYNHGGPDVIDLARLNARNAVGAIPTSLVSMAYSGYKAVRGASSEGGGFLRASSALASHSGISSFTVKFLRKPCAHCRALGVESDFDFTVKVFSICVCACLTWVCGQRGYNRIMRLVCGALSAMRVTNCVTAASKGRFGISMGSLIRWWPSLDCDNARSRLGRLSFAWFGGYLCDYPGCTFRWRVTG